MNPIFLMYKSNYSITKSWSQSRSIILIYGTAANNGGKGHFGKNTLWYFAF